MPSLLAAVTAISNSGGVEIDLTDVEELRFDNTLTIARVTGDGPPRAQVGVYVASVTTAGAIVPVTQPSVPNGNDGAGGSTRNILAYADTELPTHFGTVSMFAGGGLTASNTDYVVFTFWDCDETGSHVGSALYTGDTRIFDATLRPNSTGSWTGGAIAITAGIGVDLAAGHSLAVEWDTATHAATKTVPGGWFRTK